MELDAGAADSTAVGAEVGAAVAVSMLDAISVTFLTIDLSGDLKMETRLCPIIFNVDRNAAFNSAAT